MSDNQFQAVFTGFGQNSGDRIGNKVLELVNI